MRLYGISTTYFVADAPFAMASMPFWISSRPWPTTFAGGMHLRTPFSRAGVNQSL